MISLKEELQDFTFSENDVSLLTSKFEELAPYFLSGGYLQVRDEYRIYPTTIEFYFHSENGGIQDLIVYHRNKRMVDEGIELPYFPLMSLHAHDSGYDITFENKDKKYRASALIRAYQVWDIHKQQWIKWDAKLQKFRYYSAFEDSTPINTQVLYLKTFLNSFNMESNDIVWVDSSSLLEVNNGIKTGTLRKGVDMYDKQGIRQKGVPDKRPWSFSREKFIEIP